jgi:hypothetical protein
MTSCLIDEREIRLARQIVYEYLTRVFWLGKIMFGQGIKVTVRFQAAAEM